MRLEAAHNGNASRCGGNLHRDGTSLGHSKHAVAVRLREMSPEMCAGATASTGEEVQDP